METATLHVGYYIFGAVLVILQVVNIFFKVGGNGLRKDVTEIKISVAKIEQKVNDLPCQNGSICKLEKR